MSDKMNHCILKLKLNRLLDREVKAKDLRGAIAGLYPEKRLLHQHRRDGTVDYYYPLVQYKIINGECLITGFKEGAELLTNLDLTIEKLSLGKQIYTILAKELEFYHVSIEIINTLQQYRFIVPWLALNEKNYDKYQKLENWQEKKEFLAKVLVGNIISMSKGLGYTVPDPIEVELGRMREIKTSLKGTPMLGFLGDFRVNFQIPNYWGIGKSVSRGFGTVIKVNKQFN